MGTWIQWSIELCDVSSRYVVTCPLFLFPSVRVNWCSYVSVVIFSNSFCDQFVVLILCVVFSHRCVAQCTLHEFAFRRSY